MGIRFATAGDIPQIINLLYEFRDESEPYQSANLDYGHIKTWLEFMVNTPYCVALLDDDLRGMIIGSVCPRWHSPDLIAEENFFYVREAARGGLLAYRLLKQWEDVCTKLGATQLFVGSTAQINDERTRAFYKRMGYTLHGYTLTKRT